jgi:ferredoxin
MGARVVTMDALSVLNKMSQFADVMNKPPVSLEANLCVHQQHNQATCDRCVTACPTQAFSLVDNQIALTEADCVRCGYCAHACPTGAIHGQTNTDKLQQRVGQIPNTTQIEIACAYRPTPHNQANLQAPLFVVPRCLAGIAPSAYIELANQGVEHITLRCDACADCPIGQLLTQIRDTAQLAQTLSGSPPALSIDIHTDVPAMTNAPPEIHDTTRTEMSRRGLFQMFAGRLDPPPTPPSATHLPASLPPERQRLLAALNLRPQHPPRWGPLPRVIGNCTACEVCRHVCPTDALMVEKEKTRFQLDLNPAHCTACGLCTAACPEAVLEFDLEPTPTDDNTITLTSGELRQCQRCKTTFSGQSNLCPTCDFRRQNPFGSYRIG